MTISKRCVRVAAIISFLMTGSIFLSLIAYVGHINHLREQAVMCLAENVYHEGRGEKRENQRLIGLLTLARVADPDPQWPKTICGAIGQDRQFSWVLDYQLATKRSEQVKWESALSVARGLMDPTDTSQLLPKGWECARYYKRTDGKGVSKASQKFFDTKLSPVSSFGSHTAFQERRGCKYPLRTI